MRGIRGAEGILSRLTASGGVRKKPVEAGKPCPRPSPLALCSYPLAPGPHPLPFAHIPLLPADAGWKGAGLSSAGTPAWRRPVSVSTLAHPRVHHANTKVGGCALADARVRLCLLVPTCLRSQRRGGCPPCASGPWDRPTICRLSAPPMHPATHACLLSRELVGREASMSTRSCLASLLATRTPNTAPGVTALQRGVLEERWRSQGKLRRRRRRPQGIGASQQGRHPCFKTVHRSGHRLGGFVWGTGTPAPP